MPRFQPRNVARRSPFRSVQAICREISNMQARLQPDMKHLPYRVTATGDVFDVEFLLHPDTGSAVRVSGCSPSSRSSSATSRSPERPATATRCKRWPWRSLSEPASSTRHRRQAQDSHGLVDSALGAMSELTGSLRPSGTPDAIDRIAAPQSPWLPAVSEGFLSTDVKQRQLFPRQGECGWL